MSNNHTHKSYIITDLYLYIYPISLLVPFQIRRYIWSNFTPELGLGCFTQYLCDAAQDFRLASLLQRCLRQLALNRDVLLSIEPYID